MKQNAKPVSLLLLLISVLLMTNCTPKPTPSPTPEPEGLYYYADGEQIPLETAADHLAVRLESEASTQDFIASLRELVEEEPWQRADEFPRYQIVLFQLVEDLPEEQRLEFEGLLQGHPEVEAPLPVFRTGEERFLMVLTAEFLVQFPPELSQEEINAFNAQHQTQVVEKDRYEENLFILRVPLASEFDALEMANLYHESDATLWAAPNFLMEVRKLYKPNDTYFKEQWHLENTGQGGGTKGEDVDAVKAWDITRGNEDVVIAIIDDGVDYNHEDLKANIFKNPGEIPGNGKDDESNGYKDDVRGWDFYDDDNDPIPSTFNSPYNSTSLNDIHGTPCAGVTAARLGNNLGVAGICGSCKILPVKIFGGTTSSNMTTSANLAKAIKYASTLADVLSNSWSTSSSTAVTNAFQYAATKGRGGKGCVIVCASGNGSSSSVGYPANLSTVIAVGASTNKGVRASYSNYGSTLDIVAPSDGGTRDIYTTDVSIANRGYDDLDTKGLYTKSFGGTSSATPLAGGVAGLVLSANPNLTKAQVQDILQKTAEKIDQTNASYDSNGFSKQYGYGRVNAYEAVKEAKKRRLEGVDVYMRDHGNDVGDTPTFGDWYTSVDIKVDGPTNGYQSVTSFGNIKHEDAIDGQTNYVYVQVHNRGQLTATSTVTATVYWAYAGAGLPQLPEKFWSEYPTGPSDTTHWHPIGQQTLSNIISGTAQYATFKWTGPTIDPIKPNPNHFCLLAIINSAQDVVRVKQRDIGMIVRNDNNITLKNVNVVNTKPSTSFSLPFYINNPTDERIATELRLVAPQALEQDWSIWLDEFGFDEPIVLEPQSQILLTLEVILPEPAQEAQITVIQERTDTGTPTAVGGLSWHFGPQEIRVRAILGGEPFDDLRVQEAILHAVPWAELVEQVFDGQDVPVAVDLWEEESLLDDARGVDYDPDLAKALLAEAGLAKGFCLRLLFLPEDRELTEMAEWMAESLAGNDFCVELVLASAVDAPAIMAELIAAGDSVLWLGR